VLILFFAGPSNALTIDFEYLAHGEVANGVYNGVTISASNPNQGFDYAVGFDSNASYTPNPDLQADDSLELGNNTANRFSPITAEFLGLSEIEHVDFNLGGSGAIDNLVIMPAVAVPEPSTALLLGLGLAFIGARRHRAPS
jgi:hypothetical protein